MMQLMHGLTILPMFILVGNAAMDIWGGTIANIAEMTAVTGNLALLCFTVMLAAAPLFILFGWRKQLLFKKPMGLYAFIYGAGSLSRHDT